MRSQVFGFEHLEHRYRKLAGEDAPNIPVEVRLNLNDILKYRYGPGYADHPRIKSLMLLQGELPNQFLEGAEESECFTKMEFIRMNASTICKVQFFQFVINQAIKGKLKTKGGNLFNRIDKLLESQTARVLAFTASMAGFAYLMLRLGGLVR